MKRPRLKSLVAATILIILSLVVSERALAQTTTPPTTTPPATTTGTGVIAQLGSIVRCTGTDPKENLGALVTYSICVLSRFGTAIAVLIIMTAGLMYIFSGSNPSMAGVAKAMIITTITGLIAMYSISLVLSILMSSGFLTNGNSS